MRKELDELLCKRYPKIFAQRHLSMRETAMCWGFDCGDGWFHIIDLLCRWIQLIVDQNKLPQVETTQVKEKYGGLRFYVMGGAGDDDEIDNCIDYATFLSTHTCEVCGSMDDVGQTDGWITTLCRTCASKDPKRSSWMSWEDRDKLGEQNGEQGVE